jgi:hypothetical protein
MPRHPLPPFVRHRRALALAVLLVLPLALRQVAQKRRQLIRQRFAWQVPESVNSTEGCTLTLSPDGKRLMCRFPSERIHFDDWQRTFDTRTGDVLEDKPFSAPVSSATTPPCDVESQTRKGVRVWLPDSSDFKPHHLRLDCNGKTTILTRLPVTKYPSERAPYELRLSPDASLLFVLRFDGLWQMDVRSKQVLRVVRPNGKSGQKWATEDDEDEETVTLSPDGALIVTLAGRPTLYSARTGSKIRSFGQELATQCGGCGCIEPMTGFSPDGQLVWVAQNQGSVGNVAFWRVRDGKKLWSRVMSNWHFSPKGKFVFSDGGVDPQLLDPFTGRVRYTLQGVVAPEVPFVFSPDNHYLYTLDQNGLIKRHRLF